MEFLDRERGERGDGGGDRSGQYYFPKLRMEKIDDQTLSLGFEP